MRSRSFLFTISIGAILIIFVSIRTERVRQNSLHGYQYAAPDEDFDESKLSERDRELLGKLAKGGSTARDKRTQTIERLYGLDSEDAWNRHIEELDDEGLPSLTKFAQRYIYEHQHPESCKDKKFIVMQSFPNDENFGLGAVTFSISMNLNLALRFNRILIYDPKDGPGRHFIDPSSHELCGNSMECFFERLSSCTMDDLTPDNHILLPAREVIDQEIMNTEGGSLPQIFGIALKRMHPMITPDALKYWWRGQSASYIMRFNSRTMAELLRKRRDKALHKSLSFDGHDLVDGSNIPFPMPAGSVSMHIRHGDKGIEMDLRPFQEYIDAAEGFLSQNPIGYRKIAFVSTENPEVFEDMRNHLQKEHEMYKVVDAKVRTTSDWAWTWYWSDIPRANIGPEQQLEAFGNRTDMTINWFLQLMMAIECDMMIGTRGSGWSRMLDNLRCGWLGKCQQPFLDVGEAQDWVFYGI